MNMNKKRIYLSLCLSLILAAIFVAAGCAKPAPPPAPAPSPAPKPAPAPAPTKPIEWPKHIAIGCKPPGMPDYTEAIAVATMVNRYVKVVEARAEAYTSSTAFPKAMAAKELDLAISGTMNVFQESRGLGTWKDVPVTQRTIQRIVTFFEVTGPFIESHPKAGIKTPADLKGKRWMADLTGSSTTMFARKSIMREYGLTEQNVKILPYTSKEDVKAAFREGMTDAALAWASPGSDWISDLAMTGGIAFVSLSDQAINNIVNENYGWVYATMPAGSFKGQGEPWNSIGGYYPLTAREDLPDDLVYAITAAIYDYWHEFVTFHPNLETSKLPGAISTEKLVVPMHPGAIKYYKERGFWTAALDKKQAEQLALFKQLKGG